MRKLQVSYFRFDVLLEATHGLPPQKKALGGNLFVVDLGRLKGYLVPLLSGCLPWRLVREVLLRAAAALAFRSSMVCMTPIPFLDGVVLVLKIAAGIEKR